MQEKLQVAVHWKRFGPYHIARLIAAYKRLREFNIEVVGLETAGLDHIYAWDTIRETTPFDRHVIFPDHSRGEVNPASLFLRSWKKANSVNPDVVAVAGYSSFDSYGLIAWAKLHGRPAIMMSESKHDDKDRKKWREWSKRIVIGQCSSALCGGNPQREYLQTLGMSPGQIFLGYDAIDNGYFEKNAKQVRENPQAARQLPGLGDPTPFFLASSRFIVRKNLDGLLEAYRLYRVKHGEKYREIAPWRLVILGDGEERDNLENIIRKNKLCDVTLAGFQQIDDLPKYYGLAGAFIHPALQEQWGLVVNEAMASGLPVIVSKTAGCAFDLVLEGQTGFVFQPDDRNQLAELMLRFGGGELDARSIGQAAQAHIAA